MDKKELFTLISRGYLLKLDIMESQRYDWDFYDRVDVFFYIQLN